MVRFEPYIYFPYRTVDLTALVRQATQPCEGAGTEPACVITTPVSLEGGLATYMDEVLLNVRSD